MKQTVASKAVLTAAPVSLTAAASFGGEITAKVLKLKGVQAVAQGPGEVSGPAVAVTVAISNGSDKRVDLSQVVVNLSDKAGAPGSPMLGAPAHAISDEVQPGRSAEGTYVFSLPVTHVDPVSISVSYTAAAPVVIFVGSAQ